MTKVARETAASPRSEVEALARRLLALRGDIDEILLGLAAARTAAVPAELRPAAQPVEEAVTISQPQTTDHLAADDLTLISAIDAALAERLDRLGIVAFAQVAHWSKPDITRVSQALGLGRRICKENWIEQAAMLASGRMTAFADGRRKGSLGSIWAAGQAPDRNSAPDIHAQQVHATPAEARPPLSGEIGPSPAARSLPSPVAEATRHDPSAPVRSLAPYRGIPKLARVPSKLAPRKAHRGVVLAMKVAACLMALIVAGTAMVDRDAWGGAPADSAALRAPRAAAATSGQPVRAMLWPGACSRVRASCL
jgi:predicted flap endonuclease-1-like 5' DNA nuclease